MLDKVLDKIREIIGIEIYNTKMMTETYDKLPDDITFKKYSDMNCMHYKR